MPIAKGTRELVAVHVILDPTFTAGQEDLRFVILRG